MRAIMVDDYGESDRLVPAEVLVPDPGPGQVLVRQSLAGVNFIDVYVRRGIYRHSETYPNAPPFTPGMEGGGVVEKAGPGVGGLEPGDRVAYCLVLGAYAEFALVPAWRLVKVPAAIPMESAVTLMLQGSTAHYLACSLFPLEAGMSCLVHAGAGGVGQLLTQIARLRGARVITTVGSRDKAELSRGLGAEAILYHDEDFAGRVLEMTGGRGVDVVYDGVGQATFAGSLKAVKRRGTVALFGGASGRVATLDPLDLAEAGSVYLTRPHLWDYTHDAAEIARRAGDLFAWVADGRLRCAVDRHFPLTNARAAHDHLEAGRSRGKLLLETGVDGAGGAI
jgi:NADPH2:quinone reductase